MTLRDGRLAAYAGERPPRSRRGRARTARIGGRRARPRRSSTSTAGGCGRIRSRSCSPASGSRSASRSRSRCSSRTARSPARPRRSCTPSSGGADLQLQARSAHGFDARVLREATRVPGVRQAAPLLEQRATLVGPQGQQVAVDLASLDARLAALSGRLAGNFVTGGFRFLTGCCCRPRPQRRSACPIRSTRRSSGRCRRCASRCAGRRTRCPSPACSGAKRSARSSDARVGDAVAQTAAAARGHGGTPHARPRRAWPRPGDAGARGLWRRSRGGTTSR